MPILAFLVASVLASVFIAGRLVGPAAGRFMGVDELGASGVFFGVVGVTCLGSLVAGLFLGDMLALGLTAALPFALAFALAFVVLDGLSGSWSSPPDKVSTGCKTMLKAALNPSIPRDWSFLSQKPAWNVNDTKYVSAFGPHV